MKKVRFLSFWMLLISGLATVAFNSCSSKRLLYHDEGVVINGVKWATRNVDKPGTFAAKPEDVGKLYQWNRRVAWAAIGDVTDWDTTIPEGDIWEKANDPSPAGWRVPTLDEIKTLFDTKKVTNERITKKGVNGRRFTDKASGSSLFLPAVGLRHWYNSALYNAGKCGYCWSSTADGSYGAYNLYFDSDDEGGMYFDSDDAHVDSDRRDKGFSVRAVAE